MSQQMSLAQVIDAIAEINAEIPGIQASYGSSDLPPALSVFPCTIVLLGPDEYSRFGVTEFWIRVFVAPEASTGNLGFVYQKCLTLSSTFRNVYSHWTDPIGDRMIDRTRLTMKAGFGSTGFAYTLKWGKASYFGFSINLPTQSTVPGA